MTSPQKLWSAYERYGKNSNSLMTLYPGFAYFESLSADRQGFIAYVDTLYAWVVAAEPFAAEEDQVPLLEEFFQVARKKGKRVLVIPVDTGFAERAEKAGFSALMIGTEPTFVLSRYPPKGTSWIDVVTTAKQLAARGAVVREFKPNELTSEHRKLLDEITRNWLGSRKTATLGFLNQVRPWLYSENKKYFLVELGDKVLAFLAAIPISARKSWYLIDTMRWQGTPPGTTELLLCQAMKTLKEQGAQEVTLGVAPLSGIEEAGSLAVAHPEKHKLLYRLFILIFKKGNAFYNFEPLYHYKMKFRPTVARPVFLLYGGPGGKTGLSFKDLLSLSQAWLPHGLAQAAAIGTFRLIKRFSPSAFIKSQLRPGTTVRSVPATAARLARRCQFTLTVVTGIVCFYFLSAMEPAKPGNLPLPLLGIQLLSVAILTGVLEYLGGSFLTVLSYCLPLLFSLPFVSWTIGLLVPHSPFVTAGFSLDTVALLGTYGCLGSLFFFLKTNRFVAGVIILTTLRALCGESVPGAGIDGAIALGVGALVAKVVLRD